MMKATILDLIELSMQEIIFANGVLRQIDKEPSVFLRRIKTDHFNFVIKSETEHINTLTEMLKNVKKVAIV